MADLWVSFWKVIEGVLREILAKPGGKGPRVATSMEMRQTGYSVEADRAAKRAKLRALCDEVVVDPRFESREIGGKIRTLCNQAFAYIVREMGCPLPRGVGDQEMLAEQIFDHMAAGNGWRSASIERAIEHADRGGVAAAAQRKYPNSHVVVLRGGAAFSGSFGKDVPLVAHCGKAGTNGIMKTSQAFAVADGMPDCFVYQEHTA